MSTAPKPITKELIIVNIFCILVAGLMYYQYSTSAPATPPPAVQVTRSDVEAFVEAQHIVSQYLTAPASAQFANMSQSSIKNLSGNAYEIHSYVDSQNGYGAMLRNEWAIVFQYTGEKLDVLDISVVKLGDKVMYKKEAVVPNSKQKPR